MNDTTRLALFNRFYDLRFGDLYWAREDLLKRATGGRWAVRADRRAHPVLVLWTSAVRSLDDRIPLAIGTSRPGSATDFTLPVTPDGRATYFSLDRVAWATPRDFLNRDITAERALGEGHPWETATLWRNHGAPSLPPIPAKWLRSSVAFALWQKFSAASAA